MKKICRILLTFFLIISVTNRGNLIYAEDAKKQEMGQLYAKAALLMDASNNRVLYEKNGYEIMAMASTTKIMTCILALEYGNLEEVVEVSEYAASMPKVHLGMRAGERYVLKDLLYSLMLESHNDTAVVVAEAVAGSKEEFAMLMNEKAKSLGCENTYFVTPNGLDGTVNGKSHSTTARDLAVITSYAIKNKEFLEIINTRNYQFSTADHTRNFQVNNKNRFLDMMDGAIGVKTGFTNEAGYCFVGAIKTADRTLIAVVLGSGWPPNKNWKWKDTKSLMKYGIANYSQQNIYRDIVYEDVKVENGIEGTVPVLKKEKEISLLLAKVDNVEVNSVISQNISAPVAKGSVLGYEEYYVNGELYDKIVLTAQKAIGKWEYEYCLKTIIKKYFPNIV